MSTKRICWLDVAKGIGIFLVVISHVALGRFAPHVDSFYMAFFFFLSGCTFCYEKYPSFWSFAKKKIKTLLLPYFLFACLIMLIYWFVYGWDHNLANSFIGLFYSRYQLYQSIVGTNSYFMMIQNSALWFLTCLFAMEIIYYGFCYLNRRRKIPLWILLIGGVVLMMIYLHFSPVLLPWNLDTAVLCLPFFALGSYYMYHQKKLSWLWQIGIMILALGINLWIAYHNGSVNVSIGQYGQSYLLFYLGASTGIIIYLLLAKWIDYLLPWLRSILQFLGQNTLPILALHLVLLRHIIIPCLGPLALPVTSIRYGMIAAGLVIILIIPIILLFNRFLPWMVGKPVRRNT